MSNSSQPHGLQHAVLLCPSLSPGVCSMSCPLERVMLSNHLILCCLLLLPSIIPSNRFFSQWVISSHQVAKVLELQLQHQSFQWIFKVISFRIDWFDLLQGILKSLVQHHDSKASIFAVFLYLCIVSSPSWSLCCALKRSFHCTIRWCAVLQDQ